MDTYSEIKAYIDHNPLMILGTIDPQGVPHGAVVYACADNRHPIVYFITKQATKKYQNLQVHHQVSLTIVNPTENSTLQANGDAFDVKNALT
ncbi:MAG TPA: pyridoxamine 5'-phosphate oxidase family protein [Patescibacteria group bacterium]|nr:pyridoxamine 5'-phosphate oxidase family protein [Patescibacteria group bacterium]